jgi:peptidyl-prolyl cis-trans isomerase SurA
LITRHVTTAALSFAVALALAAAPALGANKRQPADSQQQQPAAGGDEVSAAAAQASEHAGDGVAAIVNDSVISDYDLRQRMALFLATSGAKPSDEELKQIRGQVLKQVETERLQLLEAQKNNITVSAAEVDRAINDIMKDNHLTIDQLKGLLGRADVQMQTLRSQIAAQIAWSKTVQDEYGDRVNVSKEEVDAEFGRLQQGASKPHFAVSEIFLSVDSPEQDGKVLKDAQELETQLQAGAPFATVARQFSQNPSAAQGGDVGTVEQGQLAPALDEALSKMHSGEISPPIRSAGGYYIVALRQRQEPAGTKIPDAASEQSTTPAGTLPLARILLAIGPNPAPKLLQSAIQAANIVRQHITSCATAQAVVKQMHGTQYFDLGVMRVSEMSAAMQTEVKNAGPGETTQPFQSAAGIELIVRCDKRIERPSVFVMPSRDDVEQQLFEEKMAVFSRQYLRDLRRDADIESKYVDALAKANGQAKADGESQ